VSVDFLYRHPELRARIEHLRSRQQQAPPLAVAPPEHEHDNDRGVIAALTARLHETRGEVTELKAQLAAVHGELLTLRRQLPAATLSTADNNRAVAE
jgi:hypothetical protein